MEGCQARVPASSEHGFCEQHEIIAVQLYRDLLEDVPTDRADTPELDDEEQARIEEYLRKEGLSIDTAINLSAESLATAEPQEDTVTLVKCPYCSGSHQKYLVDLCPLNPHKQR